MDWKIVVKNEGEAEQTNVVVRDRLPIEMGFKGASRGGRFIGGEVEWNVGSLKPMEEIVLDLTTESQRVAPGAEKVTLLTADGGVREQRSSKLQIDGIAGLRLELKDRNDIVEVGKTGWAYILDRETGKPLIGIDEKPVPQEPRQATAKTQPFPRGDAVVPQFIQIAPEGSALVNDGRIFTPFVGTNPTIVAPGIWGGASWPPSAYDPVQQRLFVCASSVINGFTGGGDSTFVAPTNGVAYLGGATTFTRVARTGIIAALDVTTNKIAWRYQWPEQCYSGTLATGGGLLFVGRTDGRLTALDSFTGRQLWEFQTGAGMHAPVSTFEHKGKQYLLAFSAGAALLGSARGDSVWLFGLDGTLPPAEPGRPV